MDLLGSQIVCEGGTKTIHGKEISSVTEHIQDNIVLEANTLIMDENNIVDKKKDRKLNCKPEDGECRYGDIIYVWNVPKQKQTNCDLFETKQVQGEIISAGNTKYFT